jgi:hypothetical protein
MSTEGIYLDSEIKLHHTSTESLLWQQVKRGFSNTEIRRDSIQYKGNYEFIYHIDQWQSDSLFLLGGNFSFDLYVDHRKKRILSN